MNISSSGDSEKSKEHSGYDHSSGGEENLAMVPFSNYKKVVFEQEKGKKKLLKEMHVEFDGQISKNNKKPRPVFKSNNVKQVASDPARNNSASSKKVKRPVLEAKTRAMTRAEEVQSSLGTKFPNFIKSLLKSHVSGGYWLGLPSQFCKSHLLENDMDITLENETRERFQTKYLANKAGLSGGWRTFAITQKLVEGDVAIFQLVEFNRFKVYIVKNEGSNKANEALSLVNVDVCGQQNETEKAGTKDCHKAQVENITKRKRAKTRQSSVVQKNKKKDLKKSAPNTLQLGKICEKSNKGTNLEIIVNPSSHSSQVQFKDVKSFKDFTIVVDNICIDSELPDYMRAKYYALCSDKKTFLHARLMQGLNSKLIAGMICEIVNISDSLKKCGFTTSRDEFSDWERALKSFQFLGMTVGFLRTRIRNLVHILFESEGATESRKYMEAKLGKVRAEDEMLTLESKLIELGETCTKYDTDVKALKSHADKYEHKFRKMIDAPW